MKHAGIARRPGVPVLDFCFLVYQEGSRWIGRSVLTGHVAESRTARGAIKNLTMAIDAAIEIAGRHGCSADSWHQAQKPDEIRYLAMFVAELSQSSPKRGSSTAPSGRFVLNTTVLEKKSAA